MELDKIEKLLDAYFEGETSVEEEEVLMDFFLNQNVPNHLLIYKSIFVGLAAARKEKLEKPISFLEEENGYKNPMWKYGIAAGIVLAIGVGSFFINKPESQLSSEEQEALTAFENSKQALQFISEKLNKGTQHLLVVNEFEIAKNKFLKTENE